MDGKKISIGLLVLMGLIGPRLLFAECSSRACHGGIESISSPKFPMMQTIQGMGQRHGDAFGCVVCHGGNPRSSNKETAHRGIPASLSRVPGPKAFYPDPGALSIVENSCGPCHPAHVHRVSLSLMNTDAGKIQGHLRIWGHPAPADHRVVWGNRGVRDKDGPEPRGTRLAYNDYMAELSKKFIVPYPKALFPLPRASMAKIGEEPFQAGLTHHRHSCQRCHLEGRGGAGEFRGLGCSACHMVYGAQGLYEGRDPSIDKGSPGHVQFHRIRGTRKTGGIPVETCNTCHHGGRRTGTNFKGLMEAPGHGGNTLYGKNYIHLSGDVHHRRESRPGNPLGGMICQDCHTSVDVHGDGNIHGNALAQVEIECSDCHGTPTAFPWELPLGRGDEFGRAMAGSPRGMTRNRLLADVQFGYPQDGEDGFLISARGNPLGNVVRRGQGVIVHSATGREYRVPLLKELGENNRWKSPSARVAMAGILAHMERLECYACHGAWASQAYGGKVRVDYSQDPPRLFETQAYLRWEDPILGINGEGRVAPLVPGGHGSHTIISAGGQVVVENHMGTNPGEARAVGQDFIPLALDMAPVQPHTTQARARSCESCHANGRSLGLGWPYPINSLGQGEASFVEWDGSRILDDRGRQGITVGSHWPLSRGLNGKEVDGILRTGTCLGCHGIMDGKWGSKGVLDSRGHGKMVEKILRSSRVPRE